MPPLAAEVPGVVYGSKCRESAQTLRSGGALRGGAEFRCAWSQFLPPLGAAAAGWLGTGLELGLGRLLELGARVWVYVV